MNMNEVALAVALTEHTQRAVTTTTGRRSRTPKILLALPDVVMPPTTTMMNCSRGSCWSARPCSRKCMVAREWCPQEEEYRVMCRRILKVYIRHNVCPVATHEQLPSQRKNELTQGRVYMHSHVASDGGMCASNARRLGCNGRYISPLFLHYLNPITSGRPKAPSIKN